MTKYNKIPSFFYQKLNKRLILSIIIFVLLINSLSLLSDNLVKAQGTEWYGYTDHVASGIVNANKAKGQQITTNSTASKYRIASGSAYISSTDLYALHNAKFCVWSTTGEILAVSQSTAYSHFEGWVIFTFSTTYYLNASTNYIIGIIADADTNMWTSNYGTKKYNDTNSYATPTSVTGFDSSGNAYTQTIGLIPDSSFTDMCLIQINTPVNGFMQWQNIFTDMYGTFYSAVQNSTFFYVPRNSILKIFGIPYYGYYFANTTIENSTTTYYNYFSGENITVTDNLIITINFELYTGYGDAYINAQIWGASYGVLSVIINGEITIINENSYLDYTNTSMQIPFNTYVWINYIPNYNTSQFISFTMYKNQTIFSGEWDYYPANILTSIYNSTYQDIGDIKIFAWDYVTDQIPPVITPTPTVTPVFPPVNVIVSFLYLIFGNITIDLIFVVYGIICSLLTWKFSFIGLIAGIDISTVICFATNLLGVLAYPVLGLVAIANVALIVVGSGILNKKPESSEQ